ncbi:hypothetical protein DK880_00198 [Candidatus Cardinium hertigii]|uniref:Uncharacterized protein n=1 Tax=Candidatus Cardinium hertigii TaxID=247481 RepID=A0A2Z3LBB2_9BACT|nr:hypothetical protein DK880_00198 [Candidatus Cardinium hertigii]
MRKIICFVIIIFDFFSVYASAQVNSPQACFIIMQESRFKMDFARLSRHNKIILLTSRYSYSRLEEKQKKYFFEIVQVDDFSCPCRIDVSAHGIR